MVAGAQTAARKAERLTSPDGWGASFLPVNPLTRRSEPPPRAPSVVASRGGITGQ
ncbi:hypothetical protein Slala03_50030 [Streptomyces lavendulae subsp. lavendulae]|nr:hypothetical protein Slala03_50030 [Streptomyces lavendulae subsp. lavendulae]